MTNRIPMLGLLTALLLGVLFYFLFYSPRNDDLAVVMEQTRSLETQRASLQGDLTRLRDIEANQVQVRSALARLEEFIPSGNAQSTAVRQFQLAADAAGVEIESVGFATPLLVPAAPPTGAADTALASIPVTMAVSGGYFQVVDFLRRLEVDSPRAMLMTNLNAASGEDGFPSLAASWTGSLFAVVPLTSIPTPDEVVDPAEDATPDAAGEETTDGEAEQAAAQEGATS